MTGPGALRPTGAMPVAISVVICTHNPNPQSLARVLGALREQTLPLAQWSLVVVDNASTHPIAAAEAATLDWHPAGRHDL